ncbi:MAG: transposase [Armatimonadetes bacterium]|nr:transposase [Armatimonadota bacterium]
MELIESWREELAKEEDSKRRREIYRRTEAYLDAGHGSAVLSDPRAARIVQESLLHWAQERYVLHAWSILTNHVHTLFTPLPGNSLAKIMQGIKSYTSHEIRRVLGGEGRLWQPDYFDRMIRNEGHFERVLKYIEWNPVKAGLCQDPSLFPYSSANPDNRKRLEDSLLR